MYKSDQERIVTVVLAAHIALQSSHQSLKVIILKSPPLQKDLLVILSFYLCRKISSLLVNQLHCHSHKHQTPVISSRTHARTFVHTHIVTDVAYKFTGASVPFSIIYFNIIVFLTGTSSDSSSEYQYMGTTPSAIMRLVSVCQHASRLNVHDRQQPARRYHRWWTRKKW